MIRTYDNEISKNRYQLGDRTDSRGLAAGRLVLADLEVGFCWPFLEQKTLFNNRGTTVFSQSLTRAYSEPSFIARLLSSRP
jgi:hypothetical protein